jgi:hypothetical protein
MVGKTPFRRTGDWSAFRPQNVARSPTFSREAVAVRRGDDGRYNWTRFNSESLRQIATMPVGSTFTVRDRFKNMQYRVPVTREAQQRARNALALKEWRRRTPGGIYVG